MLEINTFGAEICPSDSAQIGVSVTVPDFSAFSNDLVPAAINLGDVLCDDGSIMNADDFLTSGKIAKGIIFFIDSTGNHGLAAALVNVSVPWKSGHLLSLGSEYHQELFRYARNDFKGYENTLLIKEQTEEVGSFQELSLADYKCYYYDHRTESVGNIHLGWYVPSVGELLLFYLNQGYVNASFAKLGRTPVSATRYNSTRFSTWPGAFHTPAVDANHGWSYYISISDRPLGITSGFTYQSFDVALPIIRF